MKRSIRFGIIFIMIICLACKGNAQKVYTINVGNERLLILCKRLQAKNNLAFNSNEVKKSFTTAIAHKLDSIIIRATERRQFIKSLKKVNASALPTTFNGSTYHALNNRLKKEQGPLADDFEYCKVLEKILDLTDKFRRNKKVYFTKGKYAIPENLKPKAKEIFQPVIDNLIRISNLFKGLPFEAMIETSGYSGNQQIAADSKLYWDMAKRLQSEDLSNEEIHTYLSYLRSYDVSNMLRGIMKEKRKYLFEPEQLTVQYKKNGFGSQLPAQEKASTPEQKRRVVYVYWHILPNF